MERDLHSVSRPERLCFSGKKANGSSSSSRQPLRVELFPNFPIKGGRISTGSVLPSDNFLKKVSKSKHMELNQEASRLVASQKSMYEMIGPSVGQLVTFYVLKPEQIKNIAKQNPKFANVKAELLVPSPNVATCSLLTIEDQFYSLFGLTCLHSIQLVLDKNAPFKAQDYDQVSIFIKHTYDIQLHLWSVHEEICALVPRWKVEFLTIERLHHEVAKLLLSRTGTSNIFMAPVTINTDFLKMRKEFITESLEAQMQLQDHKFMHPLLDPEFELQPLPSFDMVTFSLSEANKAGYQRFLKSEAFTRNEFVFNEDSTNFSKSMQAVRGPIRPNNISSQEESSAGFAASNHTKEGDTLSDCISVTSKTPLTFLTIKLTDNPPIVPGDLVTLLGFHSIKNRKIENDEVYQPAYKKQFKGLVDSAFLNQNLSLGVCQVKSYQPCIFTYKGNTSEGSSGSPILDKHLRVVGINFGCYHDVQVEPDQGARSKSGKNKHKQDKMISEPYHYSADASQSTQPSSIQSFSSKDSPGLLEIKSKSPNPDDLLQFEIEVKEPGALLHQSSLKNRNLAVCTNHPAFRKWLEGWHKQCKMLEEHQKDREWIGSSKTVVTVTDFGDVDIIDIPRRNLGRSSKTSTKRLLDMPFRAEKSKALNLRPPSSRSRAQKRRS